MAITPVIEIDVSDESFQKFRAAFADYHEKLKQMPAEWGAVNQRIIELAKLQRTLGVSADKAWSNATSAASDYEKAVSKAADAQAKLGRSTASTGSAMKRMAHDVKAVSAGLFAAVRSVAGIATFGIAGGLLGLGGGLFGIDRLAHGVLERQRSARGLGLSVGQYNAFLSTMSPWAGAGVLQGAAQAQINPQKWGYIAALGINPLVAQRESASALAGQEIMAIHRAWQRNPTLLSAQAMSAMQLGYSPEAIRNIGLTPGGVLSAHIAASQSNTSAFGFSAQVAQTWADFSIQMRRAGILIESAFIRTLTPLVQSDVLGKLSKEIAGFIVSFEESGAVKQWIAELASGIKTFAAWVGSAQFKKDVDTLGHDLASLANDALGYGKKLAAIIDGVYNFAVRVGLISAPITMARIAKTYPSGTSQPGFFGRVGNAIENEAARLQFANQRRAGDLKPAYIESNLAAYSTKYGVPLSIANRLAMAESSFGKNLVSPAGALGVMQLMPATARALGVDPYDTKANIRGSMELFAQDYATYHDWAKATAAYNAGPTAVNSAIKKWGPAWLSHMPAETQREVAMVIGGMSGITDAGVGMALSGAMRAPSRSAPVTTSQALGLQHEADSLGDSWTRMRSYPTRSGSDTARTRARYWATHQKPVITIHNNTASHVHISANAAAQ